MIFLKIECELDSIKMAALLKLQKKSDKLIFHESSECLTSDNMDHTFWYVG